MTKKCILTMPIILALFTISVTLASFSSAASPVETRIYSYKNELILKLSGESKTKNFKAFCQKYAYAKPTFPSSMRKFFKGAPFTSSQRLHYQLSTKNISTSIQWCEYAFNSHAEAYFYYNMLCKMAGTSGASVKSCSDEARREAIHASVSRKLTKSGHVLDERKIVQEAERLKAASILKAKYETETHEKEIAVKIKAQKIQNEGKAKNDVIRAEACKKEFKQIIEYDQKNLEALQMDIDVIERSLADKKYKHVAYKLSSTNVSTPLIDGADGFCFQFDNYTKSHKEIMSDYSRLKAKLAHLQNKHDVEIQEIKKQRETKQAYKKNTNSNKTNRTNNVTRGDVNKLTSYAVIIGRAIGCSVNTDAEVDKVTSWLDKRFPPGSASQKQYLPMFMAGIKHHVENQVSGNSPDNCHTVKREYSLVQWP